MRKALRITVCLLIVLALPLAILSAAFALPAQYGETYLAGLGLKWDRLRGADSPRIVVAGGSGAAFDLNGALLEQELPDWKRGRDWLKKNGNALIARMKAGGMPHENQ